MDDDAVLTDDATPSTDEEAAALVGSLDDYVGYITEDEDDIIDIESLLAVGSDADDTGIVDSQSETVGDAPEDEDSEEQVAADADADSDAEETEAEGDAADEAEGDEDEETDSPPEAEAPKQKAVPSDSRDIRVLRESHKFRVSVEPLIKDYVDELPGVVGIAAAVRTGKGDSALGAIAAYSETAADSIKSHVLESEAEGYVATKLGVTAEALKAMFSEAPEAPEALKAEMEYLSDEAKAELEALLRKPVLSAEKDKVTEAKIQALNAALIDERRGGVEAAIDWQFSRMVEKAKMTEDVIVLSERAAEKVKVNEQASKYIAEAYDHAEKGRKNDAQRSLKNFFKELAVIVKGMKEATAAPAAAAVTEKPKVVAPKAPVMKPTAMKSKAKLASAAASPVAESLKKGYTDKDFLNFGRAEAKRLGVPWKD